MANKYEVPVAKVVCLEAVNILTTSLPFDTPESLNTWGKSISVYGSSDINLFS